MDSSRVKFPIEETAVSSSVINERSGERWHCHLCYRRPAIFAHVEYGCGLLLTYRWRYRRGSMCKEHGEALANRFLRRTVRWGWLPPLGKKHPAYARALRMNHATLAALANVPPPTEDTRASAKCIECGRGPVIRVDVVSYFGSIVTFRKVLRDGWYCKEHGLSIAQSHYRRTLIQGWWSPVSLFLNPWAIRKDRRAIKALRALRPPESGQVTSSET